MMLWCFDAIPEGYGKDALVTCLLAPFNLHVLYLGAQHASAMSEHGEVYYDYKREYDELVTRASACGISENEAPFGNDVTQIRLLAETLSYQHLGEEETLGNVCARNKMAS